MQKPTVTVGDLGQARLVNSCVKLQRHVGAGAKNLNARTIPDNDLGNCSYEKSIGKEGKVLPKPYVIAEVIGKAQRSYLLGATPPPVAANN